ncbi:uncharacterized protein L201_005767 [Kwoniella dendrophila CBS 6074]|uniref:REJ domain-containing protein n=1 Tax=Kwoniella dendrophila CBS 6074 TaxID=1295534 RepID=A0AAX4K241_9TREE
MPESDPDSAISSIRMRTKQSNPMTGISTSESKQEVVKNSNLILDSDSKVEMGSKGLRRRIVMNPPQSFIQYAASIQPSQPQINANGPMMINSNGQAVLLSPNNQNQIVSTDQQTTQNSQSSPQSPQEGTTKSDSVDDGQVVLKGDKVVLVAPTDTAASTLTPTMTPTQIISSVIATSSDIPSTTMVATSAISNTVVSTSVVTSATIPSSAISASIIPTSSMTSSIMTSTSSFSSSTSPSSTQSSISSPSPSSSSDHHPPSAGIIFLIILLSLAIFIALGSLFRYLLKSRRFGCLGRKRRNLGDDDDDDGLSDLVRGFDTPRTLGSGGYNPYLHATAATYPQMDEILSNQQGNELEKRSSLFARQAVNSKSPFLHSNSHSQTQSLSNSPTTNNNHFDIPNLPIPPPSAYINPNDHSEEIITNLPHHLLGETGPLEVRNALPGEVDSYEDHDQDNEYRYDQYARQNQDNHHEVKGIDGLVGLGLGQGSPRFLGVNGNGLPVPWSTPLPPRPSSIDSFDRHNDRPNPFGSSSTLSAVGGTAAAGTNPDNLVAPPLGFPSPSISHDSLKSLPQYNRAVSATWASNLRNTLYNAISAARVPSSSTIIANNNNNGLVDEDKFTRTVSNVGNIYRNASSRRKAIPVFDLEKGHGEGLKVVDEKDDPFNSMTINEKSLSSDLNRLTSTSSNGSSLVIPKRFSTGNSGERFKGLYTRSKSSTNVSVAEAGDDGISEIDDIRPPTRMAGGARAAGARTGSFVVV